MPPIKKRTNEPNEALLTLKDVAAMLNVHPQTIYALIKKANLPAIRLVNKYRFQKEDVERWVEERKKVQ
jgi:excisionase family DNA binding protein